MPEARPEISAERDGGRAAGCAWCGAPLQQLPAGSRGRARCALCGAATTFPPPTDAELDQAYGAWYRPAAGRFAGPGDRMLRATRAALARRLDRIAPAGPILDVGAGEGALLDSLRARGRTAIGLERRDEGRPGIVAGDLGEVEGSWAAIVFWHSLEHLPAPAGALERAARMLAPGGVLVVAMPNAASLQARAFGDRWHGLDLLRHLVHVPAPAVLERIQTLGLELERVSFLRGGQATFGWLHGLVGLLPGHPDLYAAIRRPEARDTGLAPAARVGALCGGVLLLPLAIAATAGEVALRRGGSLYLEARRG